MHYLAGYTVEPHGDGYAIYRGRSKHHHGMNLAHLTEVTPEFAKKIEMALNADPPQPSGNAGELADVVRVPLDSLHADAGYLIGRVLDKSLSLEEAVSVIRSCVDEAKAALAAQPSTPQPAGAAVRAFREYLAVHEVSGRMDGRAVDDMALDLARIALGFAAQPSGQAQEAEDNSAIDAARQESKHA